MAASTKTKASKAATSTKAAKGPAVASNIARRASILLKQVSDPTRLQICLMLAEGERMVGDICGSLGQSQPAVSHHLALLRHGAIIEPRRQGKNNFYSLTATGQMLATVARDLCSS